MMPEKPQKIDDRILFHLRLGPVLMLDLVKIIKNDRPNTTKQAVYFAIKKLKESEQIITYKGKASLNITWLNSMIHYFDLAKHSYIQGEMGDGSFIDLNDREKIKYYFKNPIKADVFWTHALYLILEINHSKDPVYIYNPHEWFLLARNKNESTIFDTIKNSNQQLFLIAGSNEFLDRYVKQFFDNKACQYHSLDEALFSKNNYYLNIVGDYLIEVSFDEKLSTEIDLFYKKTVSWDSEKLKELKSIVDQDAKMKIVISKNRRKAETLKKRFQKYFYISKGFAHSGSPASGMDLA